MNILNLFKVELCDIEREPYVFNVPKDFKVTKRHRDKQVNYLLESIEYYQPEKVLALIFDNENDLKNPYISFNFLKDGEIVKSIGNLKNELVSKSNRIILPLMSNIFERIYIEDFPTYWEQIRPDNIYNAKLIETYQPKKFKGRGVNRYEEYPLGAVLDLYFLTDKPFVTEEVYEVLKHAEENDYKVILNIYEEYELINHVGNLIIYDNENEQLQDVYVLDSYSVESIIKSYGIITWVNILDNLYEGKLISIWKD